MGEADAGCVGEMAQVAKKVDKTGLEIFSGGGVVAMSAVAGEGVGAGYCANVVVALNFVQLVAAGERCGGGLADVSALFLPRCPRRPVAASRLVAIRERGNILARKRKTLPKDFEEILAGGDLEALKEVYEHCELAAYGGDFKGTALHFDDCPDDLARWLVGEGLDVDTPDAFGNSALARKVMRGNGIGVLLELGADPSHDNKGRTPLHAAIPRNPESVRILLAHGADMTASFYAGDLPSMLDVHPPLQDALQRCSNAEIIYVAASARILLDAGCPVPPNAAEQVTRIGKKFEFIRDTRTQCEPDETAQALDELYDMFDVPPVPARRRHDGTSPITVTATAWQAQFNELWQYLVPASGDAPTEQGEVIRAAGRISRELLDNGGINWGRDFRAMRDQLVATLKTGTAVSTADELHELAAGIRGDYIDDRAIQRISELAVAWVLANPDPVPRGQAPTPPAPAPPSAPAADVPTEKPAPRGSWWSRITSRRRPNRQ